MVEVAPFKGITYNKKNVKDIDSVMSPPYDIISEEMQDKLYKKNDYNFVKLILGKQFQDDNANNRYTRAKKFFNEWIKKDILVHSDKPGIYPYEIEYMQNGKKKIMNGFFILLKLDKEYKLVKAHERTLSKPKEDRLNLMRELNGNLEPIQLLYIDEKDDINIKIKEKINSPYIDVTGYDGFNHKIWKIDDEKTINFIKEKLDDEILFIADGHHRYQTAINYADEMEEKTGDKNEYAPFRYRMVILVNMFDKGLSILPTHRLLKKKDLDINDIIKKSEKYFDIKKIEIEPKNNNHKIISGSIKNEIKTENENKFALYCKKFYYVFTLKNQKIMDELASDKSETWKGLDVSVLHKILLENIMGINQDNLEDHVKYTRDDDEAISFVDSGKFDFSILMNATKIEELKSVADAGEHMPQKSTYFLPKMLSGLVMYKM